MRGLFSPFYADNPAQVIFGQNRRWCAHAALLAELFPTSKIICCVRPPAHVVDSVERLVQQHPLELSAVFDFAPNQTVYERVKVLMAPAGLVGYAFHAFREMYYGPYRDRMHVVEYADLA